MKKLLLLIAVIALAGCINADDYLPNSINYIATQTPEYFKGTGTWSDLQFDNASFICITGFVYDRADTSVVITDNTGVDITCDDQLFYPITITKQ